MSEQIPTCRKRKGGGVSIHIPAKIEATVREKHRKNIDIVAMEAILYSAIVDAVTRQASMCRRTVGAALDDKIQGGFLGRDGLILQDKMLFASQHGAFRINTIFWNNEDDIFSGTKK